MFGNPLEASFKKVTLISRDDEKFLPLAGSGGWLPQSGIPPLVTVSIVMDGRSKPKSQEGLLRSTWLTLEPKFKCIIDLKIVW